MRAIFSSALAYLAICLLAAFLSLNLFSYVLYSLELDFTRVSVRVLIAVASTAYVLVAVVPFLITPFAILSDHVARRSKPRFLECLSQTPVALLRASKNVLLATFSATAVAFPLLVLMYLSFKNLERNGLGFVNFALTVFILCLGVALISPKVVGRLLYPLLAISGTYSKEQALRYSLRYSKRQAIRLILLSFGLILTAVLIRRVSPLTLTDARALFDGRVFHGLSAELAVSFIHAVPFLLLVLLSLLSLSFSLRDSRVEEGRTRFRRLLENNVSPYYISKLAKAGYFH